MTRPPNNRQDTAPLDPQQQSIAKPADSTPFLFYCDMTALSPEQRSAHQRLIAQLFGRELQETHELVDGYAYRFDGEHYPLVAAFITNERFCCPFLTFGLTVAPERGSVWLHLTAPGDVKRFLQEELGHVVSQR